MVYANLPNNTLVVDNFQAMKSHGTGEGFSRLVTAAVINNQFRNLLLTNPAKALAAGFNGEAFYFASADRDLILSIQAASLADFAMQLVENQNGNNKNGNGYGSGNGNWGKRQVHQKS